MDERLAKAQLDFAAETFRAWRFTNPLWMTLLAFICSKLMPVFGHAPALRAFFLPALATLVALLAQFLVARYRAETDTCASGETMRRWLTLFKLMQMLMSAVWGLTPWLLWSRPVFPTIFILAP